MQQGEGIRVVSVVGARPQFVKLEPIVQALASRNDVVHSVIHTGQHYDSLMSDVFFEELGLPAPDVDLGIGSASHGKQTASMLVALEQHLEHVRPDAVMIYGDTNSTLAASIAASKLTVPVAHVEAGLRSFNRKMPEEINRLVADHCSDRLYAPTPTAMINLGNENLGDRSVLSGDVMRDAVLRNRMIARERSNALTENGVSEGAFALVTIHRPVNTTADGIRAILDAIEAAVPPELPLLFPLHPRTRPVVEAAGYSGSRAFRFIAPAAYLDMLRLIDAAALVLTDSGGVQKEAAFLRTPCVTLREETEWTETIELGVNRLVGQDADRIRSAIHDSLRADNLFDRATLADMDRLYGDGHAGQRIVEDLVNWLG